MKLKVTSWTSLALALLSTLPALAQEKGDWRPASKTAESITGEVAFSNDKFTINFASFPDAEIRPLSPAEISAAFEGADGTTGRGHLYRLNIPGNKRFLHRNTLCGSEDADWIATYVAGKELHLAFFSSEASPVLTTESLSNNSNLCGTYTYVRE